MAITEAVTLISSYIISTWKCNSLIFLEMINNIFSLSNTKKNIKKLGLDLADKLYLDGGNI